MGVLLTRLEISLKAGDSAAVKRLAKYLSNTLIYMDNQKILTQLVDDIQKQADENIFAGTLSGKTQELEDYFQLENTKYRFDFGIWAAAAHAAASSGNAAFFSVIELQYFSNLAKRNNLPPGIIRSLSKIEMYTKSHFYQDPELQETKRLLEVFILSGMMQVDL